ncbi:OmpA/MotB family protein [Lachnospiraceae bacterium LCP25S3_G4]
MKKRQKAPEGGSNWMDTYGDMVTLLLCFFVLLYSISSVDQQKWELLVKSFNPSAEEVSQIVTDTAATLAGDQDISGSMEKPEGVEDDFDKLYYTLKEAVETQGLQADVTVQKGDGFTFISFKNQVFFDGDSSVLKEEGKAVLDGFASALGQAAHVIQEIDVLGHTSQAAPGHPNDIYTDRMLAAQRSTEVAVYLQLKSLISPDKLVQTSYGQYRPVDTYETSEGRARNRRVELIITKSGTVQESLEKYYNEINNANQ